MGSIRGKVINQQDGQPIADANVKATEGQLSRDVPTGKNGDFVIDSLNAGKYDVLVHKQGFKEGIYGPVAVLESEPTDLLLALQPQDI